jgi:DNA-binding NtrC family response regulator
MKKKILVVDDKTSVREALGDVLRLEGYDVFLAADGREGIAKFNAEIMDLLVLDVSLPDISGWQVFGAVTRINPFLPVVIITGGESHRNLAAWAGSGALIQKPLNVPQLLETVENLLGDSPAAHIQRLAGRGSDRRFDGPAPNR